MLLCVIFVMTRSFGIWGLVRQIERSFFQLVYMGTWFSDLLIVYVPRIFRRSSIIRKWEKLQFKGQHGVIWCLFSENHAEVFEDRCYVCWKTYKNAIVFVALARQA